MNLAARIALTAIGTTALAVAIIAVGVVVIGGDTFARLMVEAGASAADAHVMFDQSITIVLIGAVVAALVAATVLATLISRRIARPLRAIDRAARRVAAGDYGTRLAPAGPSEIAGLAESFNRMATELDEQERVRREFIANAAHELKTPLTNLRGYLEGLRDGVIAGDEATYASLQEETDRLVRLAESLDALAEGDAPTGSRASVDVDLMGSIRTALELAGPAFERAGVAATATGPERLIVRTDPDALAQVLANLLQNAATYTPRGGSASVTTERAGSGVLVSVSNTGASIAPADLPHLFERFYRADRSRDRAHGGSGIGLAIVKQLVQAWGGEVGVESSDGRTHFWFTIPWLR